MSSSGGSDDEGARETEASSTQASQRSGMFLRSQAGIGTNGSGSPDNESGSDQSEGNPSQGGSSTIDNTFFTAAAGSGSPAQQVEERIRELEQRMPFRPKNISTNGQGITDDQVQENEFHRSRWEESLREKALRELEGTSATPNKGEPTVAELKQQNQHLQNMVDLLRKEQMRTEPKKLHTPGNDPGKSQSMSFNSESLHVVNCPVSVLKLPSNFDRMSSLAKIFVYIESIRTYIVICDVKKERPDIIYIAALGQNKIPALLELEKVADKPLIDLICNRYAEICEQPELLYPIWSKHLRDTQSLGFENSRHIGQNVGHILWSFRLPVQMNNSMTAHITSRMVRTTLTHFLEVLRGYRQFFEFVKSSVAEYTWKAQLHYALNPTKSMDSRNALSYALQSVCKALQEDKQALEENDTRMLLPLGLALRHLWRDSAKGHRNALIIVTSTLNSVMYKDHEDQVGMQDVNSLESVVTRIKQAIDEVEDMEVHPAQKFMNSIYASQDAHSPRGRASVNSIQDIHTQEFNGESERTALVDKPQLDEEEDMEAILSAMDPKTMETQVCFDFLLGKCPNRTCNRLHCTQKDAQSWLYTAKQSKDPSKEGQIKALEEILTKVKSSPQPRA